MRIFRGLVGLAVVILPTVGQLAGQCPAQMIISVYTDGSVSSDGGAIYGYSSTIDTSHLCNCQHSQYQTTVELLDGGLLMGSLSQSGEAASIMASINGVYGSYYASGHAMLYCSCAGGLYAFGGDDADSDTTALN